MSLEELGGVQLYRSVRVGEAAASAAGYRGVMSGEATMHIGEVAERTGLSLRTLRHYDEVGLVTPSARTAGGFRLYTERDVQRLLAIRRMKPLGYTLEQMGELLRALDVLESAPGDGPARAALAALTADAVERRERLSRHLAMADEFLAMLTEA